MNYKSSYKSEVQKRLTTIFDTTLLTNEDIQHLPAVVKKYLVYVGAIGKPKIRNVRVVFNGSMKRNLKSGWMSIKSKQYNFFDTPARFFYIRTKMFGIPFDGLHVYSGNDATM